MKKNIRYLMAMSLILLIQCNYLLAQQDLIPTIISKNKSSIEWSNPNSWIENRIPDENDIVQINGDFDIKDNTEILSSFNILGNLYLNNKTLTINSPNIITVGGSISSGIVNGTGKLVVNGSSTSTSISGNISELIFSGTDQLLKGTINIPNVIFDGSILIHGSNSYNCLAIIGNLTVMENAVVKNTNDYYRTLTVNGDIYNYGSILDNTSGYNLTIKVDGNLLNEGVWNNEKISLIGTGNRTIEGKEFINSNIEISDNLNISNSFECTGALVLNNKILTINQGNTFIFGGATGTGTVNGDGKLVIKGNSTELSISGNISELIFSGTDQLLKGTINTPNVIFDGTILIHGPNSYNCLAIIGNLTVMENAVVKNTNDYYRTLTVNGDIYNYGSILDNTNYNLTIKTAGNIINDGKWNNQNTSIFWEIIQGATKYQLNISDSILSWPDPIIISSTSHDVSSFINNTKYWRVRDNNNDNLSNWTVIKSINAKKKYEFRLIFSIEEYKLTVPNATISIAGLGFETNTNNDGYFTLVDVPIGDYTINVKAPGFETYESTLQIVDNQNQMANIFIKCPQWLEIAIKQNIISKYDIHADSKLGIEEAIHILKCIADIDR